jgi:sulfatase maturation enzyme AslB (radical SAM superfamily)
MYLAITTNGTFLEQYAKMFIAQGVNAITVSIDGPPAVHDNIRGTAGTFDRIICGIKKLNQYRKHPKHPTLRINSMLNASDPSAMQEVIRIAVNYNAESIQFIHPMFASEQDISAHRHYLKTVHDRDLNYWQGAQEVAQERTDIEQIQTVCTDLHREKSIALEIFPHLTTLQMRHYYSMDTRFYQEIRGRCHAMWSTATLLPSGDMESCPDFIVGNCHEGSIKQAWNSNGMRMLRKRIYNKEFFTVCRACCYFYL